MQRKLSQWAEEDQNRKITDLYSLLCNMDWLRVAHKHVMTNAGRETAGIDGISIRTFNENLEDNLKKLRDALKAKTFEPKPVRRVYIPKANRQRRPLGIPSIADRIVQEALRLILEPIWECDFSNRSYGFRPNRSTHDAVAFLTTRLVGNVGNLYQWVIEGDISKYFDTIPHRKLMKAVKRRVADRELCNLLWKFLRAGSLKEGKIQETLNGTPQGGIISPLLANIYVHELDKYMEPNALHLSAYERRCRRLQGKGNYLYARYADDFVVICNGTKADAVAMKEELRMFLDQLGLKLSEEKTKVTHIKEGFTFLGFEIIRRIGGRGKMVPMVHIPESAIQIFRHKVREIIAPTTTTESMNAKITALNRLTRGWCQYYCTTSNPSIVFGKLRPELYQGMAHWLGRKYKLSMPAVHKRFYQGSTLGTAKVKLIMPSDRSEERRVGKECRS